MGDDQGPPPDDRERAAPVRPGSPAAPPPPAPPVEPAGAVPERDEEPAPDARYEPL